MALFDGSGLVSKDVDLVTYERPRPIFCEDFGEDCDFLLPVMADGTGSDYANDQTPLIFFGSQLTSAVAVVLQKYSSGSWGGNYAITGSLGNTYALGTWTTQPKYAGVIIFWSGVYTTHGPGQYRVRWTETFNGNPKETFSKPFCLKLFNCNYHNGTVRLEAWVDKGIGNIFLDKNIIDFTGVKVNPNDPGWYFQVRVPGRFGDSKSDYESEEIQYRNGQRQKVTDKQDEKFVLKIRAIPEWLHDTIKTFYLQGDKLQVTDYNANNPKSYVKKEVMRNASYEPNRFNGSKCSPVRLEMKATYNRLERFRCL